MTARVIQRSSDGSSALFRRVDRFDTIETRHQAVIAECFAVVVTTLLLPGAASVICCSLLVSYTVYSKALAVSRHCRLNSAV